MVMTVELFSPQSRPGFLACNCSSSRTRAAVRIGVHRDHGRTFISPQEAGLPHPQLLQFADPGVHPFHDRCRFEFLDQRLDQCGSHGFRIHRLRQDLHRCQVIVAIDDQPGQEVPFAKNYAVGIAIPDDPFPIGNRRSNPLRD
jgi:hypothetical protein